MSTNNLLSHSLAAAAAAAPGNVALRCGEDSADYAGLAGRVARFAAALSDAGVAPGDRVAVHCAKSVNAVVAMHGAQWAGAVSVPVDPNAPSELVAGLLRDAAVAAIVTDDRTAAKLGPPELNGLVHVGDRPVGGAARHLSWSDIEAHDPIGPVSRQPDDPAYIIYTSGSTGAPKGIVHSHRSGRCYADMAASTYDLTDQDCLANVAPFHFDQSTFELYAAPMARATTLLVPDILLRFPAEVAKLIAAERATVWYSVPTILVHLLERGALDHHDISSLRWVLFGGEVFPAAPLRTLMEHLPHARFSNVYGPAEVNQCTYHHLDGPPEAGTSIPIGGPWEGAEVVLVDDDGNVVEGPGSGLLEVCSDTMMITYWNRADLADASIVRRPDGTGAMRRWYRTGDLCSRDGTGQLHFLGRADRQVKIRGNRVELEAVEAALSGLDGVISAAAVMVDGGGEPGGEKMLVAVVEGDDLDGRQILLGARAVLPPYAVPADVVVVDALSRTSSGKVDARAAAEVVERTLAGERPFAPGDTS